MRTTVPSLVHGKTKRILALSISSKTSEASLLIRFGFIVSPSRKLQTLKESALSIYPRFENFDMVISVDTSNQKNMSDSPFRVFVTALPEIQDDAKAPASFLENDRNSLENHRP